MDGIIYLTLDQAKAIHAKTIQYSGGGTTEPLDTGKLESVLAHIQNDDYYPTFIDKLTHLFFAPVNSIASPTETNDLRLLCPRSFFYSTGT